VLIAGGGGEDDIKGEVLFQHKSLNVRRGEEVYNSCCTLCTVYTVLPAPERFYSQAEPPLKKQIDHFLKIYSKFGLLKLCKTEGDPNFEKFVHLHIYRKEKSSLETNLFHTAVYFL
jgi:hypothetical protein